MKKPLAIGVVLLLALLLAALLLRDSGISSKKAVVPTPFTVSGSVGGYVWLETNSIFYVKRSSQEFHPIVCEMSHQGVESKNVSFLAPYVGNIGSLGWLPISDRLITLRTIETNYIGKDYLVDLKEETVEPLSVRGQLYLNRSGERFFIERTNKTHVIRTSEGNLLKTVKEEKTVHGFDFQNRLLFVDVKSQPHSSSKCILTRYSLEDDTADTIEFQFSENSFIEETVLAHDGARMALKLTHGKKLLSSKTVTLWLLDLRTGDKQVVFESQNKNGLHWLRFAPHGISFVSGYMLYVLPLP